MQLFFAFFLPSLSFVSVFPSTLKSWAFPIPSRLSLSLVSLARSLGISLAFLGLLPFVESPGGFDPDPRAERLIGAFPPPPFSCELESLRLPRYRVFVSRASDRLVIWFPELPRWGQASSNNLEKKKQKRESRKRHGFRGRMRSGPHSCSGFVCFSRFGSLGWFRDFFEIRRSSVAWKEEKIKELGAVLACGALWSFSYCVWPSLSFCDLFWVLWVLSPLVFLCNDRIFNRSTRNLLRVPLFFPRIARNRVN